MSLPTIKHVLELCLYCRSLPTSVRFYQNTLGIGSPFLNNERMAAFAVGETNLLLFQRGLTTSDSPTANGGLIPGHGLPSTLDNVTLKTHFALAVENGEDVDRWEEVLKEKGVKVLGTMTWPGGGKSVYWQDPDEHVGEFASRGIWPNY